MKQLTILLYNSKSFLTRIYFFFTASYLQYLQKGVTIINENLLGDESLAPEKLCTILFGSGRLKITMKRHAACCRSQDYTFTQATRARAPQNLRPRAGDCIHPV